MARRVRTPVRVTQVYRSPHDDGAPESPVSKKRVDPGTAVKHFHDWPVQHVSSMRGAFAIQQYLQQLIQTDPSNVRAICTPPKEQDIAVWKFEHLRRFTLELNFLVVALSSVCNATTCSVMKATDEWQYLCAAHKTPKECCAIDYMVHTLDGTACLLNNNRIFPSRVSIPKTSLPYFQSIARRLYRIFSHTYFHHRQVFATFERQRFLCERFTTFCRRCKLIPEEHLMVPAHAIRGGTTTTAGAGAGAGAGTLPNGNTGTTSKPTQSPSVAGVPATAPTPSHSAPVNDKLLKGGSGLNPA